MSIIIYISLALMLIFCIMAVMSHSLLKSAIFLALCSAMLGIIMYMLGAFWSAVIEVSVCSGLITVIFISGISLSRMKKEEVQKQYSDKKRMWFLPVILIVVGVALIVLGINNELSLTNSAIKVTEDFRDIFWNTRQTDIIGEIVTILIGGIAVFVLFRDDEVKK